MTAQSQDSSSVDVNTIMGKHYSVERYYMLSEIEQHALRPVYLNNYFENNDSLGEAETVATASSETEDYSCQLPPYIVLYLLWNCSDDNKNSDSEEETAESFQKGPLEGALQKLESLSEKIDQYREKNDPDSKQEPSLPQNVFVVVDALIWSDGDEMDKASNNNNNDSDTQREARFRKHLTIVQALAKTVLHAEHNSDRIRLFGATLGLADHARAAPGLEACLEAIMVGGKDRRRNGLPKSCVGIVCHSLEDLVGYDEETDTDAVQGVMQSLTHVSYSKKSNVEPMDKNSKQEQQQEQQQQQQDQDQQQSPFLEYARKAHRYWRVHKAGLSPEPTPEELKAYAEFSSEKDGTVWIIALLVLVAAFYWKKEW